MTQVQETKTRETQEFLAAMTDRITAAETAIHNGDATPRIGMWSRTEPLTLLGAAVTARGWAEIGPTFDWLGTTFSDCTSYRNEIVAAEAIGDLAYIVAVEHTTATVNGTPATYKLRATTIYRREHGEWKAIHRHGDSVGSESLAQVQARWQEARR